MIAAEFKLAHYPIGEDGDFGVPLMIHWLECAGGFLRHDCEAEKKIKEDVR